MMILKDEIILVISLLSAVVVGSQVIFDDEPSQTTPRRQFDNQNVVVITLEQQSNGFRRPSQQQQQSNGFRRPSQQQQQSFQQPNNGFGFQQHNPNGGGGGFQQSSNNNGFQGQQSFFPQSGNSNNFQNQQQSGFQKQNEIFVASRSPDCRTYQNTGGFCTPLTACGRIASVIQNRSPFVAARILRRSICGFSGVIPSVCCPTGRTGQQSPQPVQQVPVSNNNNNNFGGGNFNDNSNVNKPGFGTGGGKGNGGSNEQGGLLLIPPTPLPTRPTTTTTTTTPFSIQLITEPVKKPVGTTPGGLIIGDGPIALLAPQKGGSTPRLGLSSEGLPEDCGFSNASNTRIVGGKIAEKGAWPWIAALGYKDEAGNINYLCGGALITSSYVITAAHCLHGRNDLATVRLGDHDLFSTGDNVQPLEVEVDKSILHPGYDPGTFKNDIALLHLKRSVPFSKQIHPVCLPNTEKLRNERFDNTAPTVVGWGAIQFNGPASSVLRQVQIPTVPDSVCQEKYKSFKSAIVDDTNICAGLQTGGKDACQGDSGGPLQLPVGTGTSRYVLIGVVSFGFKCAVANFPGIYSRVTSHLDWIQNTIKQ